MTMVIPERLENKAEVVLVVEMAIETKTMKLVVMVSIVQTLQKLQLLETGLVPATPQLKLLVQSNNSCIILREAAMWQWCHFQ